MVGTDTTVLNSTFYGNSAESWGGAVSFYSSHADTICDVRNCVFQDNTAPVGPQISVDRGALAVSYSNVEGGYEGTGNIDAAPLFVDLSDPDGPDDIWGTADDGLRLQAGSPCIDAADGDAAPATDILGNPRVDDPTTTPDTGVGTPPWADMGAYEFQP